MLKAEIKGTSRWKFGRPEGQEKCRQWGPASWGFKGEHIPYWELTAWQRAYLCPQNLSEAEFESQRLSCSVGEIGR